MVTYLKYLSLDIVRLRTFFLLRDCRVLGFGIYKSSKDELDIPSQDSIALSRKLCMVSTP